MRRAGRGVAAGVEGDGLAVEIWSDVVCPWCAIGKRRFEAALARFPHRGAVDVRWRSFELDPGAPRERTLPYAEHLAAKYATSRARADAMVAQMTATAAAEGWAADLPGSRGGNTFDAHRLLHLAADQGVQGPLKERLVAAYLTERAPIGDPAALHALAVEAGVDAGAARTVLDGGGYADAVRADEARAAAYGIDAVPFFVVDGRFGVAGAQPAEVLLDVLHRAWAGRPR